MLLACRQRASPRNARHSKRAQVHCRAALGEELVSARCEHHRQLCSGVCSSLLMCGFGAVAWYDPASCQAARSSWSGRWQQGPSCMLSDAHARACVPTRADDCAAGWCWRPRWRAWPTSAFGARSRRTLARRQPRSWPAARRRWPRSACAASRLRSACRAHHCPARARRPPGAAPGAMAGAVPGAMAGAALRATVGAARRSRSACRALPRRAPAPARRRREARAGRTRWQHLGRQLARELAQSCANGASALAVTAGRRALRQAASARVEGAGAALAAALAAKPGAAAPGADAGADALAGLAPHFGTHAGLDAARALADKAGAAAAELGFHDLDLRALAPVEAPLRELAAAAAGAAAAAAAAPAAAAAALAGWQPDQAAAGAAAAASAYAASLQDAGVHARWPRGVQNRVPGSAAGAARRQHTYHS
jgi:hypothetical protein